MQRQHIQRVGWAMILLVSTLLTSPTSALENWPQWRGPTQNGVAPGTAYPIEWSAEKNVVWKYKLPGVGASTPAIWADQIFLTGENAGDNSVLCLDRSGAKKWETTLDKAKAARNRGASGSNPSPTTDGKHVFVYFKSGTLACLDLAGKVVWQKNLQQLYGEDTLWWDLGTSPVLTKDLVVVACMQTGGSYLVAMEKATGNVAWKQDRDLDAPGESAQSYTTPIVVSRNDQEWIVTLGADHVTAHDVAAGKQLWIAGSLNPQRSSNWRSISSPVLAGDMLIAPYGRGRSLTAIRMDGSDDDAKSRIVWEKGPSADVPSPVAHDGKIYVCTDRGKIVVLKAESGEQVAQLDLPRSRTSFWSSPILANGHLYATNQDGTTYVVALGDEPKLVAENKLNDYAVATPVFVDGRIYLRTDQHLHCIGTP